MVIDHIGINIINYEKSKAFYTRVLKTLNIELVMEVKGWAGMGAEGKPDFWFGEGEQAQSPMHLAFVAPNRAAVDAFYKEALKEGAQDNGAPGLRPEYHPDYYGAFVIDLNGHNLEAVCHSPE